MCEVVIAQTERAERQRHVREIEEELEARGAGQIVVTWSTWEDVILNAKDPKGQRINGTFARLRTSSRCVGWSSRRDRANLWKSCLRFCDVVPARTERAGHRRHARARDGGGRRRDPLISLWNPRDNQSSLTTRERLNGDLTSRLGNT